MSSATETTTSTRSRRMVPGRSYSSDTPVAFGRGRDITNTADINTTRSRTLRSRSADPPLRPQQGESQSLQELALHAQSQKSQLPPRLPRRRRRSRPGDTPITITQAPTAPITKRSLQLLGLLFLVVFVELIAVHVGVSSTKKDAVAMSAASAATATPDAPNLRRRSSSDNNNNRRLNESSASKAPLASVSVPTNQPNQPKNNNKNTQKQHEKRRERLVQWQAQAIQNGLADDHNNNDDDGTPDPDDTFPVGDLDLLNGIKSIAKTPTHAAASKNRKKEDPYKLQRYKALYMKKIRNGELFDYTQEALRRTSTLPLPKTRSVASSHLAALVLSARSNFEQRRAIRETWAKGHEHVYFVIGGRPKEEDQEDPSIQARLKAEQDKYGDLLDVVHPDGYLSLPYKLKKGLEYIVTTCPDVEWIVKLDDDMAARLSTLEQVVLSELNPQVPMVIGRIDGHDTNQVFRPNLFGNDKTKDDHSKWAEYLYEYEMYPTFPLGSYGYVVSRAVAERVAHLPNPVYYQGEDTSLGIWLDNDTDTVTQWIPTRYFDNHGGCGKRTPWIVTGHTLSPEDLRRCYHELDEWPLEWVEKALQQSAQRIGGGARAPEVK